MKENDLSRKPSQERSDTDQSLRIERAGLDHDLAAGRLADEGVADQIVELARDQADAVLNVSRDHADVAFDRTSPTDRERAAVSSGRALEDERIASERHLADAVLQRQR